MHEYSLAHALLEGLTEHLGRHPVQGRVKAVHIRKGELLILSEEALAEAWRILTEGTAHPSRVRSSGSRRFPSRSAAQRVATKGPLGT